MPNEYIYRSRGESARRLGAFADQLGQRLINLEQAISQARRARDVAEYLRRVDQEYTDAITRDPSPENIFRSAAIARSRATQLGPDPSVLNFVNAKDEEMRLAAIMAQRPKERDDVESLSLRYRIGRDLQSDLDEAQKEIQKLKRIYEKGNLAIAALQRADATDEEAIAEAVSIMPELGTNPRSRQGLLKQLIQSQKNIEAELPHWQKKLGARVQPGWYTQNEDKVLRDNEIIRLDRIRIQAKAKLDELSGKRLSDVKEALGVESEEAARAEMERIRKLHDDAVKRINELKALQDGGQQTVQPQQTTKTGRRKYASREEFIQAFTRNIKRPPTEEEIERAKSLGRF